MVLNQSDDDYDLEILVGFAYLPKMAKKRNRSVWTEGYSAWS